MPQRFVDTLLDRAVIGTPVARAIRVRARATQAECAAELGVSRITFARWERAEQRPRAAQEQRYLSLLRELSEAV